MGHVREQLVAKDNKELRAKGSPFHSQSRKWGWAPLPLEKPWAGVSQRYLGQKRGMGLRSQEVLTCQAPGTARVLRTPKRPQE